MADETPEEFHERVLRFIEENGFDIEWAIEFLREYTEKKKKDKEDSEKEKHQKGGNADRGRRVGSGGMGLVLSLPMVLDLCSNLCRKACLCDSSAA
jgi:hypothetical protein